MDSPLVPTAMIMLDKERTLRMDLNTFSDFEMMTGKSIMRGGLEQCPEDCVQEHEHKALSSSDIRALLWACLVQDDERLSVREVGSMLHPGNLTIIKDALTALTANAMPEPEEGSSPDPLAAKAKRSATARGGTSSGPRPDTTSD